MKVKALFAWIGAALAIAGLVGFPPDSWGQAKPAAPKKTFTWTFASSSGAAANVWFSHPYPRFQEMVTQATGGRVKLETKVDLFSATETLNGVIGALTASWEDSGWSADRIQRSTWP